MAYVGSVGMVLAIMMASLCHEFYQFLLAQGILLGISMSLLTWPMVALVGKYVIKKRAAAMGVVIGGSSLGGVIWPIIIDRLLKKPGIGFPWTMRIVGFIMIPLLAFPCLVCRLPPTSPAKNENTSETASPVPEKTVDRKTEVLELLHKPSLQLLCLAMFFIYFGMFAPFFYTTSFAVEKGFSTSMAFYVVSIINGASFFGRVLPGIVADRFGKFNCCIISTITAGIIALCWSKVDSVAGLVIWSAAYGFSSGVSVYKWRSRSKLTLLQGILSLQQACATQVATLSTLGIAIGCVTGSTALS